MAEEFKNVRRVQTVTRQNLTDELKTKMLGYESADKALGFKDSAGTMHWYPAEGSDASFNSVTLTGFNGSTGYTYVDTNGKIQIMNGVVGSGAASMSTGLVEFGGLSINTDATKFDVAAIKAYFLDISTPSTPVVTYKEFTASTGNVVTNISSQNATYIAIDINGIIHQKSTTFTPDEYRNWIPLGVVVHSNRTVINVVNNQVHTTLAPTNQMEDFYHSLGDFVIDGNIITPNGSNLKINKSSGSIFKHGANFVTDSHDPHTVDLISVIAPDTIRYRTQTGTEYSNTNLIEVNAYDNAGTKTTIPSTGWTVQRAYLFSSNLIRIQYGQQIYASKSDAINAIGTQSFVVEQNIKDNGIFIAYILVSKTATNLNNVTQAVIIPVGKFGSVLGSGSASLDTLQTAYDNSVTPEIVTNTTLGALSIKRGSISDSDNVLKIQNGVGVNKLTIDGNGNINGASFKVDGYRFAHDNHGWEVTDSGNYNHNATWTIGTRTVSIPSGSVKWIHGVRSVSVGESIVIANTTGMHYVKWNSSGVLSESASVWDILDDVPIMAIYWNATLGSGIPFFEQHTQQRNLAWHKSAHFGIGTQTKNGGFSISGYTLAGTTDASNAYAIASGVLIDEDIPYTLGSLSSAGNYVIGYRDQAASTRIGWKTVAGVPFSYTTTALEYNNITTGTLAAITAGNYVCYYVVALQSIDAATQYIIFAGQTEYSTLSLAQAESFSSLSLGDFANFTEFVPVYKIIYQRKTTGTQAGRASTMQVDRLVGTRGTLTVVGGGDHQSLTNRTAIGAHPITSITGTANYLAAFDASGNGVSISNTTYQPIDGDLTAIAALAGTSGLLKKTALDTWSLDTSAYLTSVTGDTTSRTANTVYAAPNGSVGTATFRLLTETDIPNLNTSKLTAGTLGVVRGGTGKASWTAFSIPYASATTTISEVSPNITAEKLHLSMTGNTFSGATPVWSYVEQLYLSSTAKFLYVNSQGGGWEGWSARGFNIYSDTDDNPQESLFVVGKGSARTHVFEIDSIGSNAYFAGCNSVIENYSVSTSSNSLILRKSRSGVPLNSSGGAGAITVGDSLGKIEFKGLSSGGFWYNGFTIDVTYAAAIVNQIPSDLAIKRFDGQSVYTCAYRGEHAFIKPTEVDGYVMTGALVRFIGDSGIGFDSSSNTRIYSRQTYNLTLEMASNLYYDGTTYRQRLGSVYFGGSLIAISPNLLDFRFSSAVATNDGATAVGSSMRVNPTYTQIYNTGLISTALAIGDGTLGTYDVYVLKNNANASVVSSSTGSAYHSSVVTWSDIGHLAQVSVATTDTFSVFGATGGFTSLYSNSTKPFYVGTYLDASMHFGTNNIVRATIFNNGLIGIGVGTITPEGLVELKCATANYTQLVLSSSDTHTANVGPEISFFGKNIAGDASSFGAFRFTAITTSINDQTKATISIVGSSGEMDVAEFVPTGINVKSTSTGLTPSLFLYNSANTYATSINSGNVTSNISFTLPTSTGTNGQVLTTNGSGVLSWSTGGSGGGRIYTVELDPTETAWSSNTNYNYTVTVTGAAVGDSVVINPNSTLNSDLLTSDTSWTVRGYVSAANTVVINVRVVTYVVISTASRVRITTIGA